MKAENLAVDEKRLAALTLHALSAPDRRWVLDQLSRAERKQLEALLSELTAMGIPRDADLVNAALAPSEKKPAPLSTASTSLRAGPQALAKLLKTEPTSVAARILGLIDGAQRAAVTRLLPEDKRVAIEATQVDLVPAPALMQALAQIVPQRLTAEPRREPRP